MDKMNNDSDSKNKFEFPIIKAESYCGCGSTVKSAQNAVPPLNQTFVSGSILTSAGLLPQVSSALRWQDHWGTIKARFGVFRMDYSVAPGLYALGNPHDNSPVLVTANYKMSFDRLREALPGRDVWILVLDTDGINVWCAAGKGTFGTEELVGRIKSSGLINIVKHRKLILPQLGAPGVSAHLVAKLSGFKVQYGPIRAEDLPAYLDAGCKATAQMRIITFPLKCHPERSEGSAFRCLGVPLSRKRRTHALPRRGSASAATLRSVTKDRNKDGKQSVRVSEPSVSLGAAVSSWE